MKKNEGTNLIVNDSIVNRSKTNAYLSVGQFIEGEAILTFDKPWEGDHCVYLNFFKDGDIYRMYYLAHSVKKPLDELKVCYAESKDGFHWEKPELGLRYYNKSKANNIILDKTDKPEEGDFFDNFFVFKDTNPHCKKNQLYKALAYKNPYKLECYFSNDGIHFTKGYPIDVEGYFDTLNTCFYDNNLKRYVAYIRGLHNIVDKNDLNKATRDIRRIESKDFKNWKESGQLDFGNSDDIPLYTNNVMKLYESTYIGLPTRYIERPKWNDSFEKLTGRDARLERMKVHPRYGLAITDCLFMLSSDSKKWQRFDEAILTPGLENESNWVYGDCYPAYGYIEKDGYYHFFLRRNQWSDNPTVIYDYKIRKDGFAYYFAKYKEKVISLKRLKLKNNKIFMNFSTSAAGYIRFEISCDNICLKSEEMFGDSLNREISIDEFQLGQLIDKEVEIKIYLKDAKIYSISI